MMGEQLAFEHNQLQSWRDVARNIAVSMSLGTRGFGGGAGEHGIRDGNHRPISGPVRQVPGEVRERHVAGLVGGRVSNERVTAPGFVTADTDVTAGNGDLVAVGCGAKARAKGNLGRMPRIYQAVANERGDGV